MAVTSALTGPEIIEQIVSMPFIKLSPDLAIREGFVVTPSIKPV